MSDTIKIALYVGTGYHGADHEDEMEVEREWWESMTKEEQERYLDEVARDFLHNCVECSAWVVED